MIKVLDLVFGAVAIVGGILALFEKQYWPTGITLIIAGFLLIYFSSYVNQINENEKELRKLSERFKIHEHLITMKGDIEYLKNEQKRNY